MASYTPTSTSGNDYTKILQAEDRIYGTAGQTIPITVPAGTYHLNCYGAQGGSGYYSSKGSVLNVVSNTAYCTYSQGSLTTKYNDYIYIDQQYYASMSWPAYCYITFNTSGTYKFSVISSSGNPTYSSLYVKKSGSSSDLFSTTNNFGNINWSKEFTKGEKIEIGIKAGLSGSYLAVYFVIEFVPSFTDSTPQPGGYGGYAYGIINLKKSTTMYLVTGTQSGINGGGMGATYTSSNRITYAGNGGGASDIRIGMNDLNHRVIVAGGGGGSAGGSDLTLKRGGGPSGASPNASYQATQLSAGTNGSFGQGANASNSSTYGYGPGGGGGGWYGGGAGSSSVNDTSANGGGSGYVLTSSSHKPTGYALGSEYYLINTRNEFGTQEGDGYIAIICEELAPQKFFYYKTVAGWKPAIAIFKKSENGWQGGEI